MHRLNWDGFSRTVRCGASEKCAKPSTLVHTAYTTFPQHERMRKCAEKSDDYGEICALRNFHETLLHQNGAERPEENSRNFLVSFIRSFEFIDAQRVGANQQTILLNKY
jgi:hypothetical protein